jgi:hypothetical protein
MAQYPTYKQEIHGKGHQYLAGPVNFPSLSLHAGSASQSTLKLSCPSFHAKTTLATLLTGHDVLRNMYVEAIAKGHSVQPVTVECFEAAGDQQRI